MTRETCATCRFYGAEPASAYGRCRRSPPPISRYTTCWPKVAADGDWCGEHQPVAPAPAASDDYTRAAEAWAEAEAAWWFGELGDVEQRHRLHRAAMNARDAFLRLYREKHGG